MSPQSSGSAVANVSPVSVSRETESCLTTHFMRNIDDEAVTNFEQFVSILREWDQQAKVGEQY